ncbi:lmo0937 family membrane protein [Niabella terrae]
MDAVICIVIWALGLMVICNGTGIGNPVHILLEIAIIVVFYNVIS